MAEEASLLFRLRKIDQTRNYLLEEIKYNDLMSEKCKSTWNCAENLLILVSAVTDFVLITGFASLVCVPIGILSSSVGLNICAIISGIKKYKSIIEKKRKEHDKILVQEKQYSRY